MRSELGAHLRRQAYDGSTRGINGTWNATSPITAQELDCRIEEVNTSGNWTAYLSMCAYIWEAHALQKEMITGEVEDTQLGATGS